MSAAASWAVLAAAAVGVWAGVRAWRVLDARCLSRRWDRPEEGERQ